MFVPQPVQSPVEIRIAERTLVEQLAYDEQRPALPDEVEGVRDRAVLVVALAHAADLDDLLPKWKP